MATLSNTIENNPGQSGLRPFDSRRDLAQVADLVELCFADTLDRSGRDYLARLRASASKSSILSGSGALTGSSMNGIVWEENHRIIGNVSLIPFYVKAQRNFLIANVAVHPEWRRRGIARSMTEAAVDFVRRRHLKSVWLHVRAENQAALSLYRSLGFINRTARTTWVAEPASRVGENPPGLRFNPPAREHWAAMKRWFGNAYPAEFSWHLPYHIACLQPGLFGAAARMLFNTHISQWGVSHAGDFKASAAWQELESSANLLYLAAPDDAEPFFVRSLLEYALQHLPVRNTINLEYPAYRLEEPIREAGFVEQQILVWMERPLTL